MTTIDSTAALVIIDLQKGIVGYPSAHPIGEIVKGAALLAAAFRRHGLPVVLVNVVGMAPGRTQQGRSIGQLPAGWADLVPELNQQPSDHLVTKRTWGAFTNTDLHEYLNVLGVTQVVIAGVSTSVGVESTARQAYERGFNVTVASDAVTDTNADAHNNSVTRIFPKLGELGTVLELTTLLEAKATP